MAPKAFIYIRMSTPQQMKGDSFRRQIQRAEEYCREHALELDQEFTFHDIGLSAYTGANIEHGALGRFLGAVEDGRIPKGSYLIVESHDRLSRREVVKALPIFLEILNSGISIGMLSDGCTLHPDEVSERDLIFAIFEMGRSHSESRVKSDRGKRGWDNKRNKMGHTILTNRGPGWLVPKPDRSGFELVKDRAQIVKLIFDLVLSERLGSDAIAQELNRRRIAPFGRAEFGWQKSSVNAILKSRAVIGEFQPNSIVGGKRAPAGPVKVGYFPSVIDPTDFHAVQHKRHGRARGGGRIGEGVRNLFTHIARCGYCGGSMHFLDSGAQENGTYLVCDRARRDMGCSRVRWPYSHFETAFLTFVTEVDIRSLSNEFIHKDELSDIRHQLEASKGKLTQAVARRDRIAKMLTGDEATNYLPDQFHEADREVADTTRQIEELERRQLELKAENHAYSVSGQNIALLTEMTRSSDTRELRQLRNRLRAAIADVVDSVQLNPAGHFVPPEIQERIRSQVPDFIHEGLVYPGKYRVVFTDTVSPRTRQFSVHFRDGRRRTVRPDFKDPTQFQWIGDGDHDPITHKQVEEMAPLLGYDPAVPEQFDQAFVRLRQMSRQNSRDEQ